MIIPFINFGGQAGEAIAFYETVFNVQNKRVSYYRDMPENVKSHFPPETENYVMHAEMIIQETEVWFGDSTEETTPGNRLTLAVPFSTKEDMLIAFDKLKSDGKVFMEPETTFYSPLFAMVEDKFGIIWHLICQ